MPTLTLTTSIVYDTGEQAWTMSLATSAPSEVSNKIFLVCRSKNRTLTPEVAPPSGYYAWVWTAERYLRVATPEDLLTLSTTDPSVADVYDPDPEAPTNGLSTFGYHRYLTSSVAMDFPYWPDANRAYLAARGAIRSLMGVDVTSTSGTHGPLLLGVISTIPWRDTSIAYSVYPGDIALFRAQGGVRDYVYSLVSDSTTGSEIDAEDGGFTSGEPTVGDSATVTARVTDSSGATSDIVLTVITPSAPPASEVLNV